MGPDLERAVDHADPCGRIFERLVAEGDRGGPVLNVFLRDEDRGALAFE